jgi:hypothetical protein
MATKNLAGKGGIPVKRVEIETRFSVSWQIGRGGIIL